MEIRAYLLIPGLVAAGAHRGLREARGGLCPRQKLTWVPRADATSFPANHYLGKYS